MDMRRFIDAYATPADMLEWAEEIISSREPEFPIGPDYLHRWYIIPRNERANVFLHKMLRSDIDTFHDHPWDNTSLIIAGGYTEETPDGVFERNPGDIVGRRAEDRHRLILRDGQPSIQLFFTGPKIREWGFWCEDGRFIHWRDFVNPENRGEVGAGCGQA